MPIFIINYHVGTVDIVEGTLDSVKERIFEEITLTHRDITIHDESGKILAIARWCENSKENDSKILFRIGNGFYTQWSDDSNKDIN